jgi:hypothetical protein
MLGSRKERTGRLAAAVHRQTGSSGGGREAGTVIQGTLVAAAVAPPKSPGAAREARFSGKAMFMDIPFDWEFVTN